VIFVTAITTFFALFLVTLQHFAWLVLAQFGVSTCFLMQFYVYQYIVFGARVHNIGLYSLQSAHNHSCEFCQESYELYSSKIDLFS